ncbi:hypothetical protein C8R45DRAFT_1107310 [Mycena sanguinolenta]|nr:hypothetical protein C8R45DRAFT_1107310 [Mycena sanguinolenta]
MASRAILRLRFLPALDMDSKERMILVAAALLSPDTAFNCAPYRNERLLFEVAVSHASLWAAVEAKFRREGAPPLYTARSLNFNNYAAPVPLQRIPPELRLLLPAGLDLWDMCKLSTTCTFFRKECMLVLNARMDRAFEMFDLDWLAVRFMLTQTNAFISGWFIYHLCRMDFAKLEATKTIDLYVRKGVDAKLVSRFIKLATAYKKTDREDKTFANYGVFETIYYDHSALPLTIAVHRCWEEPRVTIMRGRLTCTLLWMCAILSHNYVPLDPYSYKQDIRALEDLTALNGISITSYHEGRTTVPTRESCALSMTCPSEQRNSFDSQSFQTVFSHTGWHRGVARQDIYFDVYWVLGAMDCCAERTGIQFSVCELEKSKRRNSDIVLDIIYITRLESAMGWK